MYDVCCPPPAAGRPAFGSSVLSLRLRLSRVMLIMLLLSSRPARSVNVIRGGSTPPGGAHAHALVLRLQKVFHRKNLKRFPARIHQGTSVEEELLEGYSDPEEELLYEEQEDTGEEQATTLMQVLAGSQVKDLRRQLEG